MASVDEVWLVDFGEPFPGEPASFRPAVIIGPVGDGTEEWPFVIVVPMTTSHRSLPVHVEVEPNATNGLDDTSYAQCELLRSISRRRLVHRLGVVETGEATAIDRIIRHLLGH